MSAYGDAALSAALDALRAHEPDRVVAILEPTLRAFLSSTEVARQHLPELVLTVDVLGAALRYIAPVHDAAALRRVMAALRRVAEWLATIFGALR